MELGIEKMTAEQTVIAYIARLKTNYSLLEGFKKSVYSIHNASNVNPKAGDQIKTTCETMAKMLVDCLPRNDIEKAVAQTFQFHNQRDWEQYGELLNNLNLLHFLLAIKHGGATKNAMGQCLGFNFTYDEEDVSVNFDGDLYNKIRAKYSDKSRGRGGFRGGRGRGRGRGGSSGYYNKQNETKQSETKELNPAEFFPVDAEKALIDDGKKFTESLQKLSTSDPPKSPVAQWGDDVPDDQQDK